MQQPGAWPLENRARGSGLAFLLTGAVLLGACGKASSPSAQGEVVEQDAPPAPEPNVSVSPGLEAPVADVMAVVAPPALPDPCVMGEFVPLGPMPEQASVVWRGVSDHSTYLYWSYETMAAGTTEVHSVLSRWTRAEGITPIGEYDNLVQTGIAADGELLVVSLHGPDTAFDGFRWTPAGRTALDFLPLAASRDGNTLVGEDKRGLVRWTEATGSQLIDAGAGLSSLSRLNVSVAADVVVASVNDGHSFRWSESTGSVDLGTPADDPRQTMISVINPSGTALAGVTFAADNFDDARSYLWTDAHGWRDLGLFARAPEGASSMPEFISDDGSVIVGDVRQLALADQYTHPFRWTEANGMQDLAPGATDAWAQYLSPSGDVVIGSLDLPSTHGFRWTETTGAEPFDSLGSFAVAADGDLVVGTNRQGPFALTFGRLAGTHPGLIGRVGAQLLPEGWTVPRLEGVSNDVGLLYGEAKNPQGENEAWLIQRPESCP